MIGRHNRSSKARATKRKGPVEIEKVEQLQTPGIEAAEIRPTRKLFRGGRKARSLYSNRHVEFGGQRARQGRLPARLAVQDLGGT